MTIFTQEGIPAIAEPSVANQASAPPMSVPLVLRGQTIRSGEQVVADGNRSVAFEIGSIIGEGGMGIVYKAVQDYPCRTVALKALKGALVESALLKRFEREVSILALLRHPGVCQLYSAGTLQDGSGVQVPFLAMELVHGPPIHQYCRKNRLNIRQKLELFLKVADAVEYVHTTGIVHRDLTCRNILVNERGEPKVLDFGLATFADRKDHSNSLATVSGHPFGTLLYASPEQAGGQTHAIDRQTDVYALGVVLYKLLTGRHPIKIGGFSTAEVVRRIQELEPDRLSRRNKKLRGDIETIVHKAMSKSKAERYGSVGDLAGDVRRYLGNEPIRARRPSAAYLATKFIRRHRVLVSTTTLIVLSLTIGLAGAMYEASRARGEANRANGEASRANAEAARANLEAHRAATQLAAAKVAQGDALLVAERFQDARNSYNAAWQEFDRVGESAISAQLGIWELDQVSARPVREVLPQNAAVLSVAISANQKWLAIARDGLVEVRDVLSNKVETQFRIKAAASKLRFSPNGRFVAALASGHYTVWDITAHKLVFSSDEMAPKVLLLALSDSSVAFATVRGTVTLREFNGTDMEVRFPETRKHIRNLEFIKDGSLLAIDSDWQLWKRSASDQGFSLAETIPHTASGGNEQDFIAISPAGGFVARFSPDEAIVFSLPELKEVAHLQVRGLSRHSGFASEGTVYIGESIQDRYQIYGVDGQLRLVLPQSLSGFTAFAGDLAAVANMYKPLVLWSTARSPGIKYIPIPAAASAGALSRDGQIAVLGGKDGLIRIYDAVGGHLLVTLNAGSPVKILKLDDATKLLAVVTQDDQTEAMASLIQFWNLATLTKTSQLQETGTVKTLALSGSGTMAMSCVFGEKSIRVWNAAGNGWISTPLPIEFQATHIELAPDLKSFLVTGNPAGIELWSVQRQPVRRCILPESGGCNDALFGENGRSILARDTKKKSIPLWRTPTDGPVQRFDFQKSPGPMAVSNFGETVVFDGGNLAMLDLQSQQLLRRLSAPIVGARIMCISNDGNQILVADNESRAIVIDFAVPATLRPAIDNQSPADQARWFAACGLSVESREFSETDGADSNPKGQTLADAYIFWAKGERKSAGRIFSASHDLGEGTRGLLLRGVQDENEVVQKASH